MDQQNVQYLVGIDLGTTHTVVAYTQADQQQGDINLFEIAQLVTPGQVAERPLLPSVRYHPASGELSEADISFSPAGSQAVVGEAARVLGAKSQGRLVSSAKSWLSHGSVDHSADILPWGASADVDKVSPLVASSSYLAHVSEVWGHRFPDAPLAQQDIVITVPASFDEGARSLTLEAARMAGLRDMRLLEEPQAVCYDWLRRHHGNIRQALDNARLLLVCDIGGGTTDLTLIRIDHDSTEPQLTRIGVGDHLMLGGDNVDLALAHLAEQRINPSENKLSSAEFSQLIEQCRIAKERLLADNAPEQINVTLLGGGSKLIGASRSTLLERDEVRQIALDGFFPLSGPDELPDKKRSGVVAFGLPYATEPAVSKHIAAFLAHHAQAAQQALGGASNVPDALLLNGGVFRSQPIRQRIIDLLAQWREGNSPLLLDNRHPELAVAFGAVSYGLARRFRQTRIGGGSARSYYLQVETGSATKQGVCILPKGSEEGNEVRLHGRQFALRIGQPVRFHLVSCSGDSSDQPGDLVSIDDERFHSLPPLAVALEAGDENEVAVELAVTHTEVGTLKIQCIAVSEPQRRWDVEFQIRQLVSGTGQRLSALPPQFELAVEKIQAVFGSKSKQVNPKAVKSLRPDLEKVLAEPRDGWNTPLIRALFSELFALNKNRRRSVNHERVWLSLAGYCLRPGFGDALDDWRVEQLWKLYPHGLQFVNERQNWSEWWTLWRRISGGLDQLAQQRLLDDISKFLNPAAARQAGVAKQIKSRGYEDMVRLAGVLEHLSAEQKSEVGRWLLKRLQKACEPSQTWWAVGRIGSRVPFYGSAHNVVAVNEVSQWLQQALKVDWKKVPQAGFAATLMSRKSGDRVRDIDDTLSQAIVEKMQSSKLPSSWLAMVEEVKQLDEQEEKQMYGEALPPGLKLIT